MAKAETKPYRGTRDFLPEDIYRREYVTGVIREVYEAHGFAPLETPAIERLETLLGKYGDEGDQLLFKIEKRGQAFVEALERLAGGFEVVEGRTGKTAPKAELEVADLGLRYDLTVPFARVMANLQGQLPPVFRRYQIQPVWRADSPGKGRFREFYQCDVDVVGTDSLIAEAEVAGAVAECLERLGFSDFEILLNHRALLAAIIEISGIDPAKAGEAIVAIDKLDKIGADGVTAELDEKGIDGGQLLTMIRSTRDPESLVGSHEAGLQASLQIERLLELSESTPAAGRLRFSPTLARGLGYYTGCIFEIIVPDLSGSLGGGGRYDGLIGMFLGRDVPAVGFSLGLERILVVMEKNQMFPEHISRAPQVIVAPLDAEQIDPALALAYALRKRGLRVELSPKKEKPGKVRKQADDRKIDHAVMLRNDGINLWSRSEPDVRDRMLSQNQLFEALAPNT